MLDAGRRLSLAAPADRAPTGLTPGGDGPAIAPAIARAIRAGGDAATRATTSGAKTRSWRTRAAARMRARWRGQGSPAREADGLMLATAAHGRG
ncbi:MAG: hypothetical protein HS111_30640 [Kofleriaceae bacterium]|nr:hypothetical protein [Kofleriaceae bacterium]